MSVSAFRRGIAALVAAGVALTAFAGCDTVVYTDVVINELMADNSVTLTDESGAYSDWIELYNPSMGKVDLSGYGLSDNPNQPFRYTIPEVTIGRGEYLLIYMDGENRVTDSGEIHASFKLSSAGDETILLTSPAGKQLSVVAVAACPTDVSVGLVQDGSADKGAYVYFSTPTPGKENVGTYTASSPESSGTGESSIPLYINEYMKKNTVLLDEAGDYSPWVELSNPGETDVALGGCYLSDDVAEPDKWQFPEGTTVPAGGCLLIYLSGKDMTSPSGEIHTSFKLGSSDTALILSDKMLQKVDSVALVSLTATASYGRSMENSETWLYFTRPTPGTSNNTVGFEDLTTGTVTACADMVYISETMSVNKSEYKNQAGEYVDWIELSNPTDETVDLSGWYLSDDADQPCFFEFPSGTTIAAGGTLLTYAAGMAAVGQNPPTDSFLTPPPRGRRTQAPATPVTLPPPPFRPTAAV